MAGSGMNIGEMFIALAFDVDETKLKGFSDGIKSLTKDLGVLSAEAAAAVFGIYEFTKQPMDSAVALRNMADATDESMLAIQRWKNAASIANPDFGEKDVMNSISNIDKMLSDIRNGAGTTKGFAMLGIDWKGKNGTQILDELKDKMPEIRAKAFANGFNDTDILKWMGMENIDARFQQAFKLSKKQFEDFANTNVMSADQVDQLYNMSQEVEKLNKAWEIFKVNMSGDIAPTLVRAMKSIPNEMKDIVAGVHVLGNSFDWLASAILPKLDKSWTSSFKDVAEVLVGFRAAYVLAVLNPITATVAAVIFLLQELGELKQFWDNNGKILPTADDLEVFKKYMAEKLASAPEDSTRGVAYKLLYPHGFNYGTQFGPTRPANLGGTNTVNQTNNITVHSTDPKAAADHTVNAINGGVYKARNTLNQTGNEAQ